MGWNSWDCFGVNVTEEEVRQNAAFMARHLKPFGWEYVVVDLAWYAPEATKDNYKQPNIPMHIDAYGRLIPDPRRFPSSAGGMGFQPLADYIHGLGLKFGIHIMRGIPWKAVEENCSILGSNQRAQEIAFDADRCPWYNSMYAVDVTQSGGQAYYRSLAQLYASWEVDFVKADDMGSWAYQEDASPYRVDEVEALSRALAQSGRDMVLSLSPGSALLGNAAHLQRFAHLWRISADFWDDWEALKRQFPRCAAWASRTIPGHWPDADMLPLGKIGIRGEIGEPRQTHFTEDEQYTLMTLWCMARSPLMFGGHLPESDTFALGLITNPEVLAVNQESKHNREIYRDEHACVWLAYPGRGKSRYVALFNLSEVTRQIQVPLPVLGDAQVWQVRNLWKREDMGLFSGPISQSIPAHGAVLFSLTPAL